VKVEVGLKFLNYIFNPAFGFVHIRPKFGLTQVGSNMEKPKCCVKKGN